MIVNKHKSFSMTGKELRDTIKASGMELKKIADALKISPQALNSRLNAAVIKTDFADEIDFVLKGSLYGNKDTTNKPSPIQDTAPQYSANSDVQAKYIALLERQESRYMEIGEAAAAKVIKALADTYATKVEVGEIRSSLELLQRSARENFQLIKSLQTLAVHYGGKLGEKTPEQIEGILHGIHEKLTRGKPSGKTKITGN